MAVTPHFIVSQQTSHLWFAITLTYINAFLYFLAEMLPVKQAIKRRFTVPPQITCASTLPGEPGKHEKNRIFQSNAISGQSCLLCSHTASNFGLHTNTTKQRCIQLI